MKKEILLDNLCRLRSDIRICGIRIRDEQIHEQYIKALDEVIEIIEKEPLKDIRTEIENVKNNLSVTPQPKWILVSERFPEEREWVGTKRFGTTISDEVYVTFESPKGERFTKHLSFQNSKVSNFVQKEIDVFYKGSVPIAWMPLPEPCELQEGEDEE